MSEEKTLTAESLVKLFQAVKMAFPKLGLLLGNLQKSATLPSTTGISYLLALWTNSYRSLKLKAAFWFHAVG